MEDSELDRLIICKKCHTLHRKIKSIMVQRHSVNSVIASYIDTMIGVYR